MAQPCFTKGPWRAVPGKNAIVSDFPGPGVIGSDEVEYYGGYLVAESVTGANAALVASAPDLYDFIATIENDDGKIPDWLWEKRETLLATARGDRP